VLVVLHWAIALLALHWDRFDGFLKGRRTTLVRQGEIDRASLRRAEVSEGDLREALRLRTSTDRLDEVAYAFLERNGEISFISQGGRMRHPGTRSAACWQHVWP